MDKNLIIVAIVSALVGVIAFVGYQALASPKTTGYASYQGFSSYEEMMQAHHGGSGSGMDSCGMSGTAQSEFATGELTDYGVTLDTMGYQKLLNYESSIKLSAAQQNAIVGLDVQMPCCGFQVLQASGNCGCGHHIALSGLAKLLASKGYERSEIQGEIDVWKNIFYPNGADSGAGACG